MKKSSHFGSQVKDIFYESKDIYEHETENKINHILLCTSTRWQTYITFSVVHYNTSQFSCNHARYLHYMCHISLYTVLNDINIHQLHIHRESKKQDTKLLAITSLLTDFQNFFTSRLCSKFATKPCLNIPPRFKHVATLPCEI